jgi:HK97 family phage major capsid protein
MLDQLKRIIDKAESEGRSLTPREERQVTELEHGARTLIERDERAYKARAQVADLGIFDSPGSRPEWNCLLPSYAEYRDGLSEGVPSEGGVTVPVIVAQKLHDRLRNRSVFLKAAPNIEPMTSSSLVIPQVASSGPVGVVAERALIPAHTLTFDGKTLEAYGFKSLISASTEILDDSAVGLRNRVGGLMVTDLSESMDKAFLGTGTIDIVGLSGQATQLALTALPTWDDIADSLSDLESAGADARMAIILGTEASKALRKQKASTAGTYVFGPESDFATNAWGRNVFVSAHLPDSRSVLVADFAQVTIGKRAEAKVAVSVDALFDTDQVAYRLTARYAGVILHDVAAATYLDGSGIA